MEATSAGDAVVATDRHVLFTHRMAAVAVRISGAFVAALKLSAAVQFGGSGLRRPSGVGNRPLELSPSLQISKEALF